MSDGQIPERPRFDVNLEARDLDISLALAKCQEQMDWLQSACDAGMAPDVAKSYRENIRLLFQLVKEKARYGEEDRLRALVAQMKAAQKAAQEHQIKERQHMPAEAGKTRH